jgi:hypothetical protein
MLTGILSPREIEARRATVNTRSASPTPKAHVISRRYKNGIMLPLWYSIGRCGVGNEIATVFRTNADLDDAKPPAELQDLAGCQ